MNHLNYWKENLVKQEIQQKAYQAASSLISSFPNKLGSTSYFRSLAARLLTYKIGDVDPFLEFLKEEKTRKKVKSYWEETSLKNKTLYEEISSVAEKKSLVALRAIGNVQNVDLTNDKKKIANAHYLYIYYFFFYLANLVDLYNEVLEEQAHVKNS